MVLAVSGEHTRGEIQGWYWQFYWVSPSEVGELSGAVLGLRL